MKYEIEQKNRSKGIYTWFLRWYDPKTKTMRYKSLKTENRNEAHRILMQKNGEIMGQDWAKAPTFRKALFAFLDDTQMTKGDGLTIRNYKSQLSPLVSFSEEYGLQAITELSFDLANEFICRFKGLKPNTIAQKLKVCRLFFKWCFKTWDLNAENPFGLRNKSKKSLMPKKIKSSASASRSWPMPGSVSSKRKRPHGAILREILSRSWGRAVSSQRCPYRQSYAPKLGVSWTVQPCRGPGQSLRTRLRTRRRIGKSRRHVQQPG